MKSTTLSFSFALPLVALAKTTGKLGDADVVTNNQPGVTYRAVLSGNDTNGFRGEVNATSGEDGIGVVWTFDFESLPKPELGPFPYHIHDQPIPASGNCTAALAHLDPTIRGESPVCDQSHPETCQVGDLSGKYGDIPAESSFETSYLDLFTSTRPGPASFFGNRSIVFHAENITRLACVNFELVDDGEPYPELPSKYNVYDYEDDAEDGKNIGTDDSENVTPETASSNGKGGVQDASTIVDDDCDDDYDHHGY